MRPTVTLELDPERFHELSGDAPYLVPGTNRTTVYVVAEGFEDDDTPIVHVYHCRYADVELRAVGRD